MIQIGKYEIVRRTGHTPLGTLYEAFDPVMRRTVSIQAPEEENGIGTSGRQTCQLALQRGGESLGRLNHPNIRNIIATEEADGRLYLVMEHVHASTLSERIETESLPQIEILKFLKMAATALDHAHGHGVLHPGLTTAHLLVDETGLLKVAGFEMSGLQSPSERDVSQEEADLLLKSVPYRAPEFLTGESVGPRADQFSLAVIAFELLTGRMMFTGTSPIATMSQTLACSAPDLKIVEAKLPSAARRVFEKAFSADADGRYASCTAMLESLEAAHVRRPASATRVTDAPDYSAPVKPLLHSSPDQAKGAGDKEMLAGQPLRDHLVQTTRRSVRRLQIVLVGVCAATILVIALLLVQSRSANIQRRNSTPPPANNSPAQSKSGIQNAAPPQPPSKPLPEPAAQNNQPSASTKGPDTQTGGTNSAAKKKQSRPRAADQLQEPKVSQEPQP